MGLHSTRKKRDRGCIAVPEYYEVGERHGKEGLSFFSFISDEGIKEEGLNPRQLIKRAAMIDDGLSD